MTTDSNSSDSLAVWWRVGVIASAVLVLCLPLYLLKEGRSGAATAEAESAPSFVGRESCLPCHQAAYESWRGSDHDRAMDVASEETVLGDFDDAVFEDRGIESRFFRQDGRFFVETEGPGGERGSFEVTHTFGHEPLQQYLIPFPDGRMQALSIAWDTEERHWFHLYPDDEIPPDDWLHWTRNGQNWNGMCAECHSTNLIKGYDPETRTFSTTWSEIDVSCEACHGPGSRHLAWAELPPMARPPTDDLGLVIRTSGMSARQQVELCAPCHARRSELGDYDHTRVDLLDNILPSLLREGLYHADGQILDEVYVHGSFVQSKMFRNGVRCSDCHDVHALKPKLEGNALCLQCHRADAFDSADHHFHKKVHEGQPSDGALCVKCHMPETAYMIIDERADHSLRLPRPDLTAAIGVPNACAQTGCHADKPLDWIVEAHEKWYGQAKKPHYGTVLASGRAGDPKARDGLIRLARDPLFPAIVRASALSLLSTYAGDEPAAAVEAALTDEEALLRQTAAAALATRSRDELVGMVTPLLFDPVRAVRLEAASRLAGTAPESLEPYQREALDAGILEYIETMEYSLDFASAGHNLGNLYSNLGDPARAESFYRQAIDVDGLFYPAKANLAILLSSRGANDEAELLLREVIEAYPERHDIAYSLGLLMAELQRFDEAAEYLERAARGLPRHARARYNLGLVLQRLRRLHEAEQWLAGAVALEPANVDFVWALADHLLRTGNLEGAREQAQRLLALNPGFEPARQILALIERAGG